MKPVICIAKTEAGAIRVACAEMAAKAVRPEQVDEDGGVLVCTGEHGDILRQVRVPPEAERSPVIIKIRGGQLEEEVNAICRRMPGAFWGGFWHAHNGIRDLSAGDLRTIARLHDNGQVPRSGLIKVLAVRTGADVELRGFVSPSKNVIIEAELFEVEDVVQARAYLNQAIPAPATRPHFVGQPAGVQRLETELGALEAAGYSVSAAVNGLGVELALRHDELGGELLLLIPPEGWERPPRVTVRERGSSRPILSPLASVFTAWNSSFSLLEVVAHARQRSAWPRRTGAKGTK
jgi:hypothetical protein